MNAPRPLAIEVCAASNVHSAGRGRHDAHRYGPCSDHARIVAEVLAHPLNPAHVAAYARAAVLVARLRDAVKPGWHTNNGFRHDDTTTAYAAGRNDLLDVIRGILADSESDPAHDTCGFSSSVEQNWWDDRTMPNDDGPDWHRDADGVLWQVDPRSGHRHRVEETKQGETAAESDTAETAHLGGSPANEES